MNQQIFFSVIIPVFNVEGYLAICIDSVLAQKESIYEIILVDDGSTDHSGRICDSYSDKNDNIHVIHKENGGLSDARNRGMEIATGDYVLFLDSDDYWCDELFLNKLNTIITKDAPDVVIFGFSKYFESGLTELNIPNRCDNNLISAVKNNAFNICAWDKAIKRNCIAVNGLHFRKGVYSEDMEWCANVYRYMKTCSVMEEAPYVYRQRTGSITRTITQENLNDIIGNYLICREIGANLDLSRQDGFNMFLAKNLSMFMIALATMNRKSQPSYYSFISENVKVLKSSSRNREKYIYFSTRIIGVQGTEYLLGNYYKLRIRGKNGKIN